MSVKFVFNPFTGNFDAVDTSGSTTTIEATCLASDEISACVIITAAKVGALYQVKVVDIDNDNEPGVGVIINKSTSTRCTVQLSGIWADDTFVRDYTGAALVPGQQYFIHPTAGRLALASQVSAPLTGARYLQSMGVALSDREFLVTPSTTRLRKVPV